MSVPVLRFKDDSGRDFPVWQERPFKDVSKINQGLQIPISERFSEGGKNRHFYITNEFLRKDAKNQYFIENPPSSVLCSESDVLMTRTGNTGKVVTNVKGAFHNNFFKIGYDKNILNKDFLCEFLCLEHTQSLILKLAGTSTIPDLNHSDFYKINIRFPSLSEQTKIANFLSAVDEKITQLTQKHDLLAQYKKGVMQQIFRQELRFKDDDGREFPEWEEKTLRELLDIVVDNRGKTPPIESVGNPLIEVNAIGNRDVKFGVITKYVSDTTYENWFRKHIKDGDVLFSTVGATALCSYFKDENSKSTIAQNIVGLRFKLPNSGLFMFYLLAEKNNNQKFKTIEMGAVQPSVKVSQMIHLVFKVPLPKEQTKIANFLTAIDDKINQTQAELNAVKQYKQGLLQQMFV